MSVSKWAYTPEKCDGDYCYGDCDNCPKANEDEEGDDDMDETTICDLIEEMQGLYDNFVTEAAKIVEQAKERAQALAETPRHKITNRELIEGCENTPGFNCRGKCKYNLVCAQWKEKNGTRYSPDSAFALIHAMKPEWLDEEA